MSIPSSRDELKAWIYRELGAPVITINLDDSQVEDAIDDALEFWQEYHVDGTKKQFIAIPITEEIINEKRIKLDPGIKACTRLFKFLGTTNNSFNGNSIFSVEYQLRLNDLWDLSSTNMTGYVVARQYLELIDDILNIDLLIRYRESEGYLHIDTAKFRLITGHFLMLECYQVIDPDEHAGVWKNRVLRKLAAAYARKRWGNNLIKFQDVQLEGGVTLNGSQILQVAQQDIATLEEDFIRKFQEPDLFFVE